MRRRDLARIDSLSASPALDYLEEISSSLDRGYPGTCVTHACRLAELLLADGKHPWIARLRDVQETALGIFHGPLRPMRLAGPSCPTWTTHYVACEGDHVYDPLASEPMPLARFAVSVFGRELPVECFLDAATTAERCRRDELRAAFQVKRVPVPDRNT